MFLDPDDVFQGKQISIKIVNESKKLERVKIKLYKENHRLYRENKILKHPIESEYLQNQEDV